MKVFGYLVELHVAGCLADAGWDVCFPHRDKGFEFVISKRVNGSPIPWPVQVKGNPQTQRRPIRPCMDTLGS